METALIHTAKTIDELTTFINLYFKSEFKLIPAFGNTYDIEIIKTGENKNGYMAIKLHDFKYQLKYILNS